MYDPITRRMIQGAPALANLDLNRLPEELTNAYASIVTLRLQVQGLGRSLPTELAGELERLRRLANTYEGYVALLPEGELRVSAAFVAASAHHLVNRADALLAEPLRATSTLSRNFISSDVSALLLFLIAGSQSDAAEIAKRVETTSADTVENSLLSSIQSLAEGTLQRIIDSEQQPIGRNVPTDFDEAATNQLWMQLLTGLRRLARNLLGEDQQDPIAVFRAVQAAATSVIDVAEVGGLSGLRFLSAFPGPHQLATLLIQAGETLLGQSVTRLQPPPGLGDQWKNIISNLARRRPYLWPNHIAALKQPVLSPGTSAVISLPTGAGKTTMAELKIAAALTLKGTVIYLVPTHALGDQVKEQLRRAFPDVTVSGSSLGEGFYAEIGEDKLPPLMVMTPERCLTLLGMAGVDFQGVSLVVFDECHLLHPTTPGRAERRSVDSALCLLKLLEVSPNVDVLLMSAMMSNFDELAAWLQSVTKRPAIPLGIEWKPTRQARGCLIFTREEISALKTMLAAEKKISDEAWAKSTKKRKSAKPPGPDARVRKKIVAHPLGFFSLKQTWEQSSKDYSVLKLSDSTVPLTANAQWLITPNKNVVASDIGARFAALGIKTLVFVQNKGHCESVAANVAKTLSANFSATALTEDEQRLLAVAIEETGDASCVLGSFGDLAVCHHGLLLPVERHLTERMFCRANGPALLTATPTLAQGMNLPTEVVIIGGDVRFEVGSKKPIPLEAHELLNAAGRAGRAGHVADGLVLVIRDDVVPYDEKNTTIGGNWGRLRKLVFAKTDQCLAIGDPIDIILDLISSHTDDSIVEYAVRRLPIDEDGGDESAKKFLRRSFAAYKATQANKASAYDKSVTALLAYRKKIREERKVPTWLDALSVSSGISIALLEKLDVAMHSDGPILERPMLKWVEWFFEWLDATPAFAVELFKCRQLAKKVMKENLKDHEPIEPLLPNILKRVRAAILLWMDGEPLNGIEAALGTEPSKIGTCDRARELVRNLPDISYGVGLMTLVHRGRLEYEGRPKDMPLRLATIAACVREGHRSPASLAISYIKQQEISRKACRTLRKKIGDAAKPKMTTETFRDTMKRVGRALRDLGL